MASRIKNRIEKEIPPSQAAYHSSCSTTKHAFALKPAVERILTSKEKTQARGKGAIALSYPPVPLHGLGVRLQLEMQLNTNRNPNPNTRGV